MPAGGKGPPRRTLTPRLPQVDANQRKFPYVTSGWLLSPQSAPASSNDWQSPPQAIKTAWRSTGGSPETSGPSRAAGLSPIRLPMPARLASLTSAQASSHVSTLMTGIALSSHSCPGTSAFSSPASAIEPSGSVLRKLAASMTSNAEEGYSRAPITQTTTSASARVADHRRAEQRRITEDHPFWIDFAGGSPRRKMPPHGAQPTMIRPMAVDCIEERLGAGRHADRPGPAFGARLNWPLARVDAADQGRAAQIPWRVGAPELTSWRRWRGWSDA